MGMSTTIVGTRELDDDFKKLLKVKKACDDAGMNYPRELYDVLKYPEEKEEYLRREYESVNIDCAIKQYSEDATDVFEIDLSKLPKGVKKIKFRNSY